MNNPLLNNFSRRELLRRTGMGFGAIGLAGVLNDAGLLAAESTALNPLAPRKPQFAPKARRVIHLFMNGGPSHVDTFDPKPALEKYHGKPLQMGNLRTERKTGAAMRSPFKFARYGKSGIQVSELFTNTAQHIDDMAIIRSIQTEVPNPEPSLPLMNVATAACRDQAWGLGLRLWLRNQNLPGFVVMCPGGTHQTTQNWALVFLPGVFQGT